MSSFLNRRGNGVHHLEVLARICDGLGPAVGVFIMLQCISMMRSGVFISRMNEMLNLKTKSPTRAIVSIGWLGLSVFIVPLVVIPQLLGLDDANPPAADFVAQASQLVWALCCPIFIESVVYAKEKRSKRLAAMRQLAESSAVIEQHPLVTKLDELNTAMDGFDHPELLQQVERIRSGVKSYLAGMTVDTDLEVFQADIDTLVVSLVFCRKALAESTLYPDSDRIKVETLAAAKGFADRVVATNLRRNTAVYQILSEDNGRLASHQDPDSQESNS